MIHFAVGEPFLFLSQMNIPIEMGIENPYSSEYQIRLKHYLNASTAFVWSYKSLTGQTLESDFYIALGEKYRDSLEAIKNTITYNRDSYIVGYKVLNIKTLEQGWISIADVQVLDFIIENS